jgi:hypothetical protein
MVFWVTNRYKARGWNFERFGPELTGGVVERLRDGASAVRLPA